MDDIDERVERIRRKFPIGTRVEYIGADKSEFFADRIFGTVRRVGLDAVILVNWDNNIGPILAHEDELLKLADEVDGFTKTLRGWFPPGTQIEISSPDQGGYIRGVVSWIDEKGGIYVQFDGDKSKRARVIYLDDDVEMFS